MENAIKTMLMPALTAKKPTERLTELYRKVGWDGEKTLDPTKVKITESDYQHLIEDEQKHAKATYPELSEPEIKFGVNALWLNSGPSGSGKTPGMVELYDGWVRE